jgi:hypothetical protein
MREAQILACLGEGVARISEMVPRIYAGLEPALRPAAALSVYAHLRQLAREGRVTPIDEPKLGGRFRLAGR